MSALDHLGFIRYRPSPVLRSYIQCYWRIRRAAPVPGAGAELMHPEGGGGLIFNFGAPLLFNGRLVSTPCLALGPNAKTTRLAFTGAIDALGVRFFPGRAYGLFQRPLVELVDIQHSLDELNIELQGNLLAERLALLVEDKDRVMLLDTVLQQRVLNADSPREGFIAALDWIRRSKGILPVADLSGQLGIGQRQLERLFRHWLGLTPKQYSKLQRVGLTRSLIKSAGPGLSLTDTAYQAGYFDQAHFNHEFKQVTGLTPGQYMRRHTQRTEN
ncbi:helix-turn-helix domain-containing protein [Bowmanella dokdonensis]|uniref:AraC family transcriptional regulator n=1 Tax=Bowmanella dokdonensis TaxID=751969 RepID=A0A939DPJ2_9ALTE|nr:helix-turn-helix domain-containing protein [Bowmanella dokdonensis]MBN7826594.1 AraC family transcriptional regulator [Bowmanella dokdonensis]